MYDYGVTGKGGKVDGFTLAALSQFSLAALSQNATVNAGRDRGGATTRLRYRRALNVSVDSATPGGRDPRGRLVTPTGSSAGAEKACAGAVLVAARALPGLSRPHRRGIKPLGYDP